VDADVLASWMLARIDRGASGSVCVFALDCPPESVVDSSTPAAIVRRYLDAGGRLVWGGHVPFSERAYPDGTRAYFGGHGNRGPFEFRGQWNDLPEAPELTDEGRALGLKHVEPKGDHCLPVSSVTTVLARVGKFNAAAWILNFNPKVPGSGFYRIRNGALDGKHEDDIEEIARVATHEL
jgi:hypothetical protein